MPTCKQSVATVKTSQECETALTSQFWSVMVLVNGVDYGVGHGVSLVVGPRVGHGPWGQSLHLKKYSKLLSCLKFQMVTRATHQQ